MTERDKIIEIIDRSCGFYCGSNVHMDDEQEGIIADALIEAGLKFDRNISYTATLNLAQLERINDLEKRLAKAAHRAEVAEMALKIVCRMQENLNILVDGKPWTKEEIYNRYIEQAEKELVEEKKDE